MKIARSSVLLLAIATAGTAVAAEPTKPAYQEVTVAGVKVGVDPATGRLRPLTADESRELDAALVQGAALTPLQARIAAPATVTEALATRISLPGGGTAMKLPESEESTVRAITLPDGRIVIEHDGAQAPAAREISDR